MVFQSLLSSIASTGVNPSTPQWGHFVAGSVETTSGASKCSDLSQLRTFDEVSHGLKGMHERQEENPLKEKPRPSQVQAKELDADVSQTQGWGTLLNEAMKWMEVSSTTKPQEEQKSVEVNDEEEWQGYFVEAERRCFDWRSEEEIKPMWEVQRNYGTFSRKLLPFANGSHSPPTAGPNNTTDKSSSQLASAPPCFEHTVTPSDTIPSLAVRYRTTVEDICCANGVYGSRHNALLVRRVIRIPITHEASAVLQQSKQSRDGETEAEVKKDTKSLKSRNGSDTEGDKKDRKSSKSRVHRRVDEKLDIKSSHTESDDETEVEVDKDTKSFKSRNGNAAEVDKKDRKSSKSRTQGVDELNSSSGSLGWRSEFREYVEP